MSVLTKKGPSRSQENYQHIIDKIEEIEAKILQIEQKFGQNDRRIQLILMVSCMTLVSQMLVLGYLISG